MSAVVVAISSFIMAILKVLLPIGIVVLIMIVTRIPISINILFVIPLMVELWLLCFGIMCILLHFGVYVEDLANVVNIVLKLAFYLTGIFFSIERRIGKKFPVIAVLLEKVNPMAYIISGTRQSLIYSSTPDILVMVIWFVISVLICCLGVWIIYKNENSYAKVS